MKKMIAMILAAGAMSGFAAPTANEDFVVAEDAKTYTNAVQAAKEYTDAAVATAARPATRIVTEDGTRFTDATGCVFAVSFAVGRFVVTNLFQMAPGVEFVYTNINPIAWALVGGSPAFQQMAKFVAYDATMRRWIALNVSYESLLTPENIAGFDASFQSATNTPIDAASFTLYDRGYVGDADHAEGTFYNVAGAPVTSLVDRVVFESSVPQSGGITTNDVCNIVTNEVAYGEWTFNPIYWDEIVAPPFYSEVSGYWVMSITGSDLFALGTPDATRLEWHYEDDFDGQVLTVSTRKARNALGLARLVDLPPLTNGLATAASLASLSSQLSQASQAATNYTDVATSNVVPSKSIGGYAIATNVAVEVGYGIRFLSLNDFGIDYMSVIKPATDLPYPFQWNLPTYDDIDKREMTLVDNYALFDTADAATNYTDSAISSADTTYTRFAISAPTNINQSVQYINITDENPSFLSVVIPEGSGTKDWIIYVNSRTNVTISLPAATWWLADTSATNDIAPQTPTALYFSQAADGIYTLGRQEFTEVVIP